MTKKDSDRARYLRLKAEREAVRAPDPILALTETERAYLAGLIDGEGSIFVGAIGARRDRTCYPVMAIGMTDRGVIEWVASKFGCTVSYVLRRKKNPNWNDQFFVRLSGKRVQILCIVLLPYLKVKRRQAELVCQFPCDARSAPGLMVAGSAVNVERHRLRDLINDLNHRPRNPHLRRGASRDG